MALNSFIMISRKTRGSHPISQAPIIAKLTPMTKYMKIQKIPNYKDYSKYLEIQGKNPILLEWPKYKKGESFLEKPPWEASVTPL